MSGVKPTVAENSKYSELSGEELSAKLAYIQGRWGQFAGALRDARQEASKFIALVNTGGAATVLAFIGGLLKDRPDIANTLTLRLTLASFVLGIACACLAHAASTVRLSGLFTAWRRDVLRFYDDAVDFATIQKADVERSNQFDPGQFFIWMALLCFSIGAALGLFLVFNVS